MRMRIGVADVRYLYANPGARRRVMHIARHSSTGEILMVPLCERVSLPFNRTINAPWALGRPVCRWCLDALDRREQP